MPDLVGGYSSLGFDINPLDISYRAEEKVDYYIDFGSALVRVAWAANTGGASEAAKTIGIKIELISKKDREKIITKELIIDLLNE